MLHKHCLGTVLRMGVDEELVLTVLRELPEDQ